MLCLCALSYVLTHEKNHSFPIHYQSSAFLLLSGQRWERETHEMECFMLILIMVTVHCRLSMRVNFITTVLTCFAIKTLKYSFSQEDESERLLKLDTWKNKYLTSHLKTCASIKYQEQKAII